MQGVVRCSGQADHAITRTQYTKQSDGQCMGAGHEVVADESILAAKDFSEDFIQNFSAAVAITIAGGWSEVRFTYTVLDESGQNLFTVVLCNAVNLLKAWKSFLLCFVTQSFKLWVDVKKTHGSIISL